MAEERSNRILTVPNAFTMLRVVLLPVILWLMSEERFNWALTLLIVAGISDGLDGFFARWLNEKTLFGMYLDPIADKLLLSSSFLMLSVTGQIPWLVTGLILARDATIIITVVVLVLTTTLRKFPPSFLGKLNTVVQLIALYVVMLDIVYRGQLLHWSREVLMFLVPALVIGSGVHYSFQMLRKVTVEQKEGKPNA